MVFSLRALSRFAILFAVVVLTAACGSNKSSDRENADIPLQTDSAVYKFNGNAMIVYRPNDASTKALMKHDRDSMFVEALADHKFYANAFEKTITSKEIRFVTATERFITIDNGLVKTYDTNDPEYKFGVILTKPGVEPMIQRGLFTDMEYAMFARDYFGIEL